MNRILAIDYFKSILVIIMILAHSVQLLGLSHHSFFYNKISHFANVTTFPCFLFSFGYVINKAYFKNYAKSKKRILNTFLTTIIAFFFSSFALFSIQNKQMTFQNIIDILTLKLTVSYSEFLLSFAVCTLLAFFPKQLLYLTKSAKVLFITTLIFFILPFITPYASLPNFLGSILGTSPESSFPILQYLPYFLLGFYLARYDIIYNRNILILVGALSVICIIQVAIHKILPDRFPPNFYWIYLPAAYCYLLFLFCNRIGNINLGSYFKEIGANTLLYLITSNIILFFLKYNFKIQFSYELYILINLVIFYSTHFIIKISKKPISIPHK